MRVVLLGSNQLLYYGSQILAKVLIPWTQISHQPGRAVGDFSIAVAKGPRGRVDAKVVGDIDDQKR